MSNQGYVTNPNNFKATYEIEYIDDKYTWEVLWDNTDDKWELYKKKTFDNASEAMTTYAYYRMSELMKVKSSVNCLLPMWLKWPTSRY